MRSRAFYRSVAAAVAVCSLFASATTASADSVGSEKQKVAQLADQLDNLENRIGQLDEDYGAAQDKKAELDQEIADSQAKIAQQEARLAELSGTLGDIAVDKYVTGSALELSPLFSNAAAYTEAEQKDSLSRLALDSGSGSTDEMLALSEDLAKEQDSLSKKQQQVADLVTTLDSKLAEAQQLQTEYTQKLSSAQADLGAAIEQERDRRAEAAAAAEIAKQKQAASDAAAAAAAQNSKNSSSTPRGGGTGSGSGGGGNAPAAQDPTPSGGDSGGGGGGGGGNPAPPVSSMAGHCRQRGDGPARRVVSVRCGISWRGFRLFGSHQVCVGPSRRVLAPPVRCAVRVDPPRVAERDPAR